MIGSLRGALLDRWGAEALIEVAGVGYRVTTTPTTSVELGEVGAEVFVYVHHVVREDSLTLYGFLTADERATFEALLGAHGVGPSLALAILGVHPPASLRRVLADEDLAALCLVPGVGKKTAQRLLVELSSRLDLDAGRGAGAASPGVGPRGSASVGAGVASARADVREALTSLGYDADEVSDILRGLPEDGSSSELLRLALQALAVR